MKADIFNKTVKNLLRLQHWLIGKRVNWLIFDEDNWYWEHEWSESRSRVFIFLMTIYLMVSRRARNNILQFPFHRYSYKFLKRAARDWEAIYGWKIA